MQRHIIHMQALRRGFDVGATLNRGHHEGLGLVRGRGTASYDPRSRPSRSTIGPIQHKKSFPGVGPRRESQDVQRKLDPLSLPKKNMMLDVLIEFQDAQRSVA